MKILPLLLAVALLLGLGYVAAGPYLTVVQIRTGIIERDSVMLERHIDFPRLREGLKAQLNAKALEQSGATDAANPLTLALAGLASQIVDGMVDAFVTPAGLAQIMAGETPEPHPETTPPSPPATTSPSRDEQPRHEPLPFADARYVYDDLATFSVWVPDEDGRETRFVLERDGLRWRLVNIVLPTD
ncbi:DUF2939 domain-containing protein [Marichromatium bheemlicum]|uniref:DUF2939 domain-containing protein n=1 Tax=Marichromatium bheemlicum TaxID=365339 RepID=A0ABX1I4X2_9GAMM|nr:DUF2939 domain-containing protein [Marichromatium bheemlicum]NKN32615.1 DUF2939 domain-containing protein [Marichromatium bheemlicum]